MGEPNERKCQILGYILECADQGCTSADLADALGIRLTNASELLRHHQRNGLIRRKKSGLGRRTYVYFTARKTERELAYWSERLEKPIQATLINDDEPSKPKPIKAKLLD